MFIIKRCARVLSCVAALGILAPSIWGVEPILNSQSAKPQVFDIKLTDGMRLAGQVVDANGKPEVGSRVALLSKTTRLASTETDKQGRFTLPVDKPGAYRIVVENRAFAIRAWRADVAPPHARVALLCVTSETVRGQLGGVAGGVGGATTVATAVVASVAIPTVVGGVIDVGIIDIEERKDTTDHGSGEPAS